MPWPIRLNDARRDVGGYVRRDGVECDCRLGYELRAQGWKWREIFPYSGHASLSSVANSVHRWARNRELPWPPVMGSTT